MRNTIAIVLLALAAAIVYFTPQTPDESKPKLAVFGRTLCPWCPPHEIWINKRTSPSGEGEMVRPL